MGTFDVHSDLHELDGLRGPDGLAAVGVFTLAGAWTGSHGRTGLVPDAVVKEIAGNDTQSIEALVSAGLWERTEGGYRMLRGPHSDPHLPMPLWRYSDTDLGGPLFQIDDTPNN